MTIKANLHFVVIATGIAGVWMGGCSMQTIDRPDWSLNGPKPLPVSQPAAAKKYGDWKGPNAPKPLTFNNTR